MAAPDEVERPRDAHAEPPRPRYGAASADRPGDRRYFPFPFLSRDSSAVNSWSQKSRRSQAHLHTNIKTPSSILTTSRTT